MNILQQGGIYRLLFPNGKAYIGQTRNFENRFKGHKMKSKGGRTILYAAWRKYGQPDCQILAILSDGDMNAEEIKAIKIYNTMYPNGYNLTVGGETCNHTDEVKAKISAAHKGVRKPSLNGNKHGVNQVVSHERRKAMSERMKGNKLGKDRVITDEYRMKFIGNKHAEGMTYKHSDEAKRRISLATKTRMASPEARAKLAAAKTAYWANYRKMKGT